MSRQARVHPRRPQRAAGRRRARSPTTRASARRCPAIRDALDAGAAVMVTSHLGPADRGQWSGRRIRSRRSRARLAELLGREVPLVRDWVDGGAWHARCARAGRAARELPLQQGREEGRRGARAQDGRALRRLRQRCLRHRASRRGDHPRHRAASRRSPAPGPLLAAELDALGRALGAPEAAAGGDRRRHQGLDQADDPASAWRRRSISSSSAAASPTPSSSPRACRSASRWPSRISSREAQAAIAAMKARGGKVPMPVDVVIARRASPPTRQADRQGDRRRRRRRPDPRHRPADGRGPRRASSRRPGTIVWNGPVGVFEFDAFAHGTKAIARAIARVAGVLASPAAATRSPRSPSTASTEDIGYISTGGGAFLELLEGKTLPAFEILEARQG